MTLDDKIEDLHSIIRRIDGHTKVSNIVNRAHGVLGIGLGLMCYHLGNHAGFPMNVPSYAIGTGFVIDGISSLATGKMHYVLFRVTKAHPKYELQKLEKQKNYTVPN
ncbi:MAG: hypothetical protein ACMXYK_05580 [Candidatus Woesearchaeota archaeon]